MISNVDRTLEEVRSLKASAKSDRDSGFWGDSLGDLNEAIQKLRRVDRTDIPLGFSHAIDAELADTYGQVGGVERRWAMECANFDQKQHLERSLAAYDIGFEFERQLSRDLVEAPTYNRVNRLVARVLLQPTVLNDASLESTDFSNELREADNILGVRIKGPGQRDPWVYCDIGTVKLLLGTDWLQVVQQIQKLRPPPFVYDSWLSTLTMINAVASHLLPELPDAIRQVERAARYSR